MANDLDGKIHSRDAVVCVNDLTMLVCAQENVSDRAHWNQEISVLLVYFVLAFCFHLFVVLQCFHYLKKCLVSLPNDTEDHLHQLKMVILRLLL